MLHDGGLFRRKIGALPKGRSLVPGCGRGYDAIAFGKSGYDSTGLDLSPTGVEQAKALLAEEKADDISGKVNGGSINSAPYSDWAKVRCCEGGEAGWGDSSAVLSI